MVLACVLNLKLCVRHANKYCKQISMKGMVKNMLLAMISAYLGMHFVIAESYYQLSLGKNRKYKLAIMNGFVGFIKAQDGSGIESIKLDYDSAGYLSSKTVESKNKLCLYYDNKGEQYVGLCLHKSPSSKIGLETIKSGKGVMVVFNPDGKSQHNVLVAGPEDFNNEILAAEVQDIHDQANLERVKATRNADFVLEKVVNGKVVSVNLKDEY